MEGSSSVGARTLICPGQPASDTAVNEVPQLPQNPRSTPGEVSQTLIRPSVTSKFSFFKPHHVANPAPDAFWQERQ